MRACVRVCARVRACVCVCVCERDVLILVVLLIYGPLCPSPRFKRYENTADGRCHFVTGSDVKNKA